MERKTLYTQKGPVDWYNAVFTAFRASSAESLNKLHSKSENVEKNEKQNGVPKKCSCDHVESSFDGFVGWKDSRQH